MCLLSLIKTGSTVDPTYVTLKAQGRGHNTNKVRQSEEQKNLLYNSTTFALIQ